MMQIPSNAPDLRDATPVASQASTIYLGGYAALNDHVSSEPLGGDFELFAGDRTAIFRVLIHGEDGAMSWLEYTVIRPDQIAMMRRMCAMFREATP